MGQIILKQCIILYHDKHWGKPPIHQQSWYYTIVLPDWGFEKCFSRDCFWAMYDTRAFPQRHYALVSLTSLYPCIFQCFSLCWFFPLIVEHKNRNILLLLCSEQKEGRGRRPVGEKAVSLIYSFGHHLWKAYFAKCVKRYQFTVEKKTGLLLHEVSIYQ